MKSIFKPGDKREFRRTMTPADLCSTFSLARDFELAARMFVLEMKDEIEDGVATFLSIEHKTLAWEGEEVKFSATVVKLQGQELTCAIIASVGDKIIARGSTGQKIVKKDSLLKR